MGIDISQFLDAFYEESFEGLQAMESDLLSMDLGTVDKETVNAIFRAAHSIKGGGGTFGLHEVSEFTHVLETLLDQIRAGQREITSELHQLLLQSVDCLRELLLAKRNGDSVDAEWISNMQTRLQAALANSTSNESPKFIDGTKASTWHIVFKPHRQLFTNANDPLRIFRELERLGELQVTACLEQLPELAALDPEECLMSWILNLTGDISRAQIDEVFEWVSGDCELQISTKDQEIIVDDSADKNELNSNTQAASSAITAKAKNQAKDTGSIRVGIDKIDALINIVGELVITQSMLSQLGENFDMSRMESLTQGLVQLSRNTRELQESVLGIRMLPISYAFNRFPRMVHDISNKLSKKVELKLTGETTEVDKTVMEMIGDPLVHLVRNAIDHGIELPADRRKAGKSEMGHVYLDASHRGGNIIIKISDDGRGIDRKRVLQKAIAVGAVGEQQNLSDNEILELVFHPGLSTVENVSDLSGRGVGMDVVRNNIRQLGGSVEVASTAGEGTTFTIRLPLTLAILDGQTIVVGDESYIIPLVSIIESIQVRPEMLNRVAGKGEIFKLRNEYLPIIRLHEIFGIKSARSRNLIDGILVVVEGDGRRCGLFVDELAGQQQVVIKSLEDNYKRVEGISGATILGDGSVALILDLSGLIRLHNQSDPQARRNAA